MRTLPDDMTAALAHGAAKLCHVWIVTPGDGVRLGFSDHDRVLTVLGVTCQPDSGWMAGASSERLSEAGDASVAGVLASERLSAADITAGLYDGAKIETFVVDWSDPAHIVRTGAGTLARLEARGGVHDGEGVFIAHVEGVMAALDRVIGRRFSHTCDAVLGDARCGVDLSAMPGAICDKRYRTCQATFDNTLNFRGFPDLPGEDFLTLYPRSGQVMDGGRRGGGGR